MTCGSHEPSRGKIACLIIVLYGIVVVTSGVWRIVSAEGGTTGLWFGLVAGSMAGLSGALFWKERYILAKGIGFFVVALVGGWFGYESFVKKGFFHAETRQLLVIGISLLTAVALFVLPPNSRSTVEVRRDV